MIVYFTSDNFLERTIVVDRDKAPAYLPVSLLPFVTVEIVTNPVEYDNDYKTSGGVSAIHIQSYGGISPKIIVNIKMIRCLFRSIFYNLL